MEQKLTNITAWKYPQAQVRYNNEIRTVFGICETHYILYVGDTDEFENAIIEDCQLILTPLSVITDEDCLGVSKTYGHYSPTAEQGLGIIENCFTDYEDPNEITLYDGIKVGDFLRSKGYDCDKLIEQGIAISLLETR